MKAVAQDEIISLIADLNSFADRAERLISTTQSTYDKNKKNVFVYNNYLSHLKEDDRNKNQIINKIVMH